MHPCPQCKLFGVRAILGGAGVGIYQCKYCHWATNVNDKLGTALLLVAKQSVTRDTTKSLQITDGAWEWLIQTGHAAGYMRASSNARGVGFYIEALSKLSYTDARPSFMRSTDQWWEGATMPRLRKVVVLDRTSAAMRAVADQHGITPYRTQRPVLDGRHARAAYSAYPWDNLAYTSVVLEAIGIGWLRATSLVEPPPPRYYLSKQRKSGRVKTSW